MKTRRKMGRREKKENIQGTLFALSPLVGFLLFGVIPLAVSLVLSFGKVKPLDLTDIEFVGFENYVRIFTEDTRFFKSIGNTFLYSFASVLLSMIVALLFANFLNRRIRFKKVFRLILFIPYVCSVVATSMMWKWMLDYNYGILNDVTNALGIGRVNWMGNPATAMPVMIVLGVWSGFGYNMILYTAALSAINRSYYEAAQLDGASGVQCFFRITLPLVSPTTFYLAIMGLIGALQSFANFQVMTPTGGPEDTTLTMVFRVWQTAFEDRRRFGMGYASAMGWIVGMIIMIFTSVNFALSKKWVHYE